MKRLWCLITVLTLVLSFSLTVFFPCSALASDAQPSDNDYMISLEPSSAINYVLFKEDYTRLIDRYIGFDEFQYITSAFGSLAMIAVEYDFTSVLRPYFGLMSTSSNVWFKFDAEFIQFTDPSPLDSDMTIYTAYDVGNGYTQRTVLSGYTVNNGDNVLNSPVYNLGSQFLNAENLNYLTIQQRINLYMNPDRLYDYEFMAHSFSLIVYIEGVSGSDVGLYLVIDGGFKDIDDSLSDLKSEVNAMRGQLDNIDSSINQGFNQMGDKLDGVQGSINQGFDSVLKPDASDKVQSDKFGSGMSDKVEQGDNILEDMGQMQKPNIDSVIVDDILSDNEADGMVKLMDTVQPILVSALFGRTLLISLILALVAYIFYGKR